MVKVKVWALLLVLALFHASGSASAAVIILELKNGDRITGELVSEDEDRLVIKSPVLGRIKVPRTQISKREQPAPAPVAQSTVTNAPATTARSTSATNAPTSLPLPSRPGATSEWAPLAILRPFLTNWHGTVQFGADLGWGTSDRETFYGNVSVNHSYQRLRNLTEYHVTYGFADDVLSANLMNGAWKIDVDVGQARRLYVYNQFGMGYDTIRHIQRQMQEGVGLGYKVIQRARLVFNTEAGGAYQTFDYNNAPDRDFVSLRIGENLSWNLSDKLKLTHRFAFMPSIQNLGDYRWHFDVGLSYPFLKRFTLNLNVLDDYDSRPAPNVEPNSLQIQSTVGIVF